jgi:hypothetical protein
VEKVPVVTTSALDSNSSYPQPGVIACRILGRKIDATGREILTIDTETAWSIQSATGQTCFELLREHLVEF